MWPFFMKQVVLHCSWHGFALLSQDFPDMASMFCTSAVGKEQTIKRGGINLEKDTWLCCHTAAQLISFWFKIWSWWKHVTKVTLWFIICSYLQIKIIMNHHELSVLKLWCDHNRIEQAISVWGTYRNHPVQLPDYIRADQSFKAGY